jgi:hypothetical protein
MTCHSDHQFITLIYQSCTHKYLMEGLHYAPNTHRTEFAFDRTPSPGLEAGTTNRKEFAFETEAPEPRREAVSTPADAPVSLSHQLEDELDWDTLPPYFPFRNSQDEANKKTTRPGGSKGRPARGGYRLRQALNWDKRSYRLVQVG